MAASQPSTRLDLVGLNPTGRPRKSSAASRRKTERRNLAAAAKSKGGTR